jgi:hypothetical protein
MPPFPDKPGSPALGLLRENRLVAAHRATVRLWCRPRRQLRRLGKNTSPASMAGLARAPLIRGFTQPVLPQQAAGASLRDGKSAFALPSRVISIFPPGWSLFTSGVYEVSPRPRGFFPLERGPQPGMRSLAGSKAALRDVLFAYTVEMKMLDGASIEPSPALARIAASGDRRFFAKVIA